MPFNFGLIFSDSSAERIRAIVDGVEAALRPGAWPNYVLGIHDVHRVASRLDARRARVAMMLLLTLRDTPTLYYGDEIGMHDVDVPPESIHDPFEKNLPGLGLGRDPERTPIQWSSEPNAGFCPADGKPWLPLAPDYSEINVEVENQYPTSMLSLTRALIDLRRSLPALVRGEYGAIDAGGQHCFALYAKRTPTESLSLLTYRTRPRWWQSPCSELETWRCRLNWIAVARLTCRM